MWKKQACHKNISFDNISFNMVTWQPYEESQEIAEYVMCQSYLISFDIAEYYMPNRVLRQFEKMQGVPVTPPKWDRREKVGVYPINWTVELGKQIKDWKQR
ncbi:hypothetical protein AMTR_s00106p00097950 [Amborella trichopoda]|uniref:Aminotransferase-like plant mobile domain-containing protein n=1 Tax=Amborella trichopoda TaxID=13333 RepID=W1NYK3_AMBTC|nr:hypothetical protein AMTR_s00106p00097950 [Amborella trichopoda]